VSNPIRILIADDHAPTRAGVRAALAQGGFEFVAEVSDAPSAVAAALREHPDVCLLDIHMPGSGIAAADEITKALPGTAVVMLTVSRNDADLFDALRAGAAGYLLKDTNPARLGLALKGVLAGEAALPRTLVARLVDEFRDRGRYHRIPIRGRRGAMLTSRESEVLDLLRHGCSTKQIAERLFLSQATIRSHVAAILKKLGVPDRASAIELVEREARRP
jgi:DNA-binding NarL/FixJ family response regulator